MISQKIDLDNREEVFKNFRTEQIYLMSAEDMDKKPFPIAHRCLGDYVLGYTYAFDCDVDVEARTYITEEDLDIINLTEEELYDFAVKNINLFRKEKNMEIREFDLEDRNKAFEDFNPQGLRFRIMTKLDAGKKELPLACRDFMDFVVGYEYLIDGDFDAWESTYITEDDLSILNLTEEDLYKIATENMGNVTILDVKEMCQKHPVVSLEENDIPIYINQEEGYFVGCLGLLNQKVIWDFAMEQNDNLYLFPINPYTYYIVKEQDMPLCKTDFKEMQLRDAKNDYRFHNEEWKEMEGCKYYYDRNAMAVTKITY